MCNVILSVIAIVIGALGNDSKRLEKRLEETGDQWKNWDHRDHNIKIS